MKRILFLPLVLTPLVVCGCAAMTNGPRSSASAGQMSACQARADEIYALRHPTDAMQANNEANSVGSPFSGAIGRSEPQLLAAQHARDQLVTQCLNGQTGEATTTVRRPKTTP